MKTANRCFPTGGTRVLAYPAAHYAVADGQRDYAFRLSQLAHGRRSHVPPRKKRAGDAVLAAAKAHFDPLMAQRLIGVTLNVDESPGQVYDGKHSNIHPLFK